MNLINHINIKKTTYFFLFTFCWIWIPVVISAQEKTINIQEKSISYKIAFEQIEKQSGYSFAYTQSKINLNRKISLSLKNTTIHQALSVILINTGHQYKINGYHIILLPVKTESKQQKAIPKTQTISGKVIEEETGEPIGYANVALLKHPSKTILTDSLGYFLLDNIPVGFCDLTVNIMGYQPAFFHNLKSTPGQDILLGICPKEHPLNEIVITENCRINKVQTSQMGMLSISQEAIKNVPVLFGEADIIKALQTQPGVSAGTEGLAGMYVRGGNQDENLYLFDGNPLYQVNHAGGLFSAFNTEAVEKINFYKSAFPARYGGRLSSVVDIHSKNGNLKEYHGSAMLGLTSGSLNIGGPLIKDKTSFQVSIRRSWLEAISIPALALINNAEENNGEKKTGRYAFTDLNLKAKHHFSNRSQAYISFYFGQDYLKFGTRFVSKDDMNPYDKENINKLRWGNMMVTSGWTYQVNEKLYSTLRVSYTNYASTLKRTFVETAGEKNTVDYNKNTFENSTENGIEDWSIRADFNYYPAMSHHIRFGSQYTHHEFRPEIVKLTSNTNSIRPGIFSNEKRLAHELNGYIEDDWSILPVLSVNAGLHMSYFNIQDKSHLFVEPRISTRFLITPDLSVKASYSRMTQCVQQVCESYISLPTDFWMPISKNQKPLVSDQLSAGVYYNHQNKYTFSVEGYYKWMNNLLDYKDGYDFQPSTTRWEDKLTSGKGWSYGADLMVTKESGQITGHIGYGLMWANRQFAEINKGEIFPSKYDNRHKLNIVANWRLNEKIELNGSWMYMTGNRITLSFENYQEVQHAGFPAELAPTTEYYHNSGLNYYDQKNNFRLPDYHRLDLGMNIYCPKKNGRMGIWNISLYNAYCRMNPIVIQKKSLYSGGSIKSSNIDLNHNFQKLSVFPILPSVSYTYKF